MTLWLLKLTLAPLLVAFATLVARQWGPRAGGVLIGFPLITGPISLFLAIDHGLDFAERATVGILFGLVGLAAFALTYTVTSRQVAWPGCLAAAAITFAIVSVTTSQIEGGIVASAIAAYAALVIVVLAVGRPQADAVNIRPPWWDLWVRMIVAAILTLTITIAAGWLGPVLSGIIGTYPVVSTVMMAFTHHQWGRNAAIAMLRGSLLSWIAFVSCFLVIGLALKDFGLVFSYSLGALAAVVTSVIVLSIDRRVARFA